MIYCSKRKIEDIYYQEEKLSKILSEYDRQKASYTNNNLFLSEIDLSNTMFSDIDFSFVLLEDANLTDCLFIRCNFNSSLFKRCDFTGSQFSECHLERCNFDTITMLDTTCFKNDFSNSVFRNDCCLTRTHFKNCNFAGSLFSKTSLTNTKFFNSNLFDVTFCDSCDLHGNDFDFSNLTDCLFKELPCEPAAQYMQGKILTKPIIGYKKCEDDVIVKLEIPRGAIVFSINGRKCRTNKAKVIEIIGAKRAMSTYTYMTYYVGDEFTIYDFNCLYNQECATGIHFFTTLAEAENYKC